MTHKTTKDFLISSIRTFFSEDEYQILLIGSYAKKKTHPKSDIDLVIKGKSPLPAHLWQELESLFEESDLKQSVDVIDYQRVHDDFKKIIDEEGLCLEKVEDTLFDR